MRTDARTDLPLARYAGWMARGAGWDLGDVAKKLKRPNAETNRSYASRLLAGQRPVSEKVAPAFAETFAWPLNGRCGARRPVYVLALIYPDGTPHLLRDEEGSLGYIADRDFAWQLAATLRAAGFRELTAIPAWPVALEASPIPIEAEGKQLDAGLRRSLPTDARQREAGERVAREVLRFAYEAIGLSDQAQALAPEAVAAKT